MVGRCTPPVMVAFIVRKFIEVKSGRRHLWVPSPDYGKFLQHYVKGNGWYTCLATWMECPFCQVDNGLKYDRKVRFYFNAIELDRGEAPGFTKILALSQARASKLLGFFDSIGQAINEHPFYLQINNGIIDVEFSKEVPPKIEDLILYDWEVVNKPVSLIKAKQLIRSDSYKYPSS